MAGTQIFSGNPLAQQNWRAGVTVESERAQALMIFEGKKNDDGIVELDRPNGQPGDIINVRFSAPNRTEIPGTDSSTIVGQEQGTNYKNVSVQMRYMVKSGAIINEESEQNLVSFDLKRNEVGRIAREWAETKELSHLRQLAGYDGVIPSGAGFPTQPGGGQGVNTIPNYTLSGGNLVLPPDKKWYLVPGSGSPTTETGVAALASAQLSNRVIEEVIKRFQSRDYGINWPMAPMRTPWGMKYVLLVSGSGYQQMRQNSSTNDMYDLFRAELQGGGTWENNSLISGQGFHYDNVVVLRSDFLPWGIVNAGPGAPSGTGAAQANCRRAVLLGQRAAHCIYGSGFTGGDHFGYSEFPVHRRLSIIVDTNYGFARTVLDVGTAAQESFGCAVISHYSDV